MDQLANDLLREAAKAGDQTARRLWRVLNGYPPVPTGEPKLKADVSPGMYQAGSEKPA